MLIINYLYFDRYLIYAFNCIHYSALFQVYSDSDDGKRYMQFYQVKKWPCIDVIDPITGK